MTVADARKAPPPPGIAADPSLPCIVFYAALSKGSNDPERESIASQFARVRAAVEAAHPDGFALIADPDDTQDDGYSGSKGDRGPGLEAAIIAARTAAATGAHVELWANTPARFARGTGRRDEARSLLELFTDMKRAGVELHTVKDDLMMREEFIGFASHMAAKYAEDLSESVTRAKVREHGKGQLLGGKPRDGYRIERDVNADTGKVTARRAVLDPPRAAIWRDIFALAREGVPDARIARRMNVTGHRTRSGRPFTRLLIERGVENPFYAGRLAYKLGTPDESIIDGAHEAICPPADFDALQLQRKAAKASNPRRRPRSESGRPARNHALAGLATCGECGAPMHSVTSKYVRRDGTRARTYQCQQARQGTGVCHAPPVSAELVDAAVIAELDRLLIDFDAWLANIERGHSTDRDRLAAELERAEHDRERQHRRHEAVSAKWADLLAEGEDGKAAAVLARVEHEAAELERADVRLTATRDALASIPEHADGDALLDFANGLREAVRGRLENANGSMGAVNAGLRELFEAFTLRVGEWAGIDREGNFVFGGERRAIIVRPYLLVSVAHSLHRDLYGGAMIPLDRDADAPPLRWLDVPPRPDAPTAPEAPAATVDRAMTEMLSTTGRA